MSEPRPTPPRGLTALLLALAAGMALLAASCQSDSDLKLPHGSSDAAVASCLTRADCAARPESKGKICGPNGTCERCTTDGQCDLRELCDPKDQICVFKRGWGRECTKNIECDAGKLCVQGLCKPEQDVTLCRAGACLADGQRCNQANQVCEEDVGCLADADCAAAELCNVPTNTCVLRCTPEKQAEVCAGGQKCVDARCSDCAENADCPGGLVCDKGKLKCISDGASRCATNRDCAVGLVCNAATGFCTAKPPPCISNEDCLSIERCDVPSGKCLRKACQPDRYERNDDSTTASTLTAGSYTALTLCESEQDWYGVKLQRGDHLDVFVDADPLLGDYLDTRILDSSGRIITQGSLAVDRTVATDGTYYLRLQSQDPYVEYGLRLSVSKGVPCDDDHFEPNDDVGKPSALHAAGDYDKLTLCPADVDFLLLDVPAGKGVKVELNSTPTEGALDMLMLSVDGKTELARTTTTEAVETAELAASQIVAGKVLLKILSADSRSHGEYFLHVSYTNKATP